MLGRKSKVDCGPYLQDPMRHALPVVAALGCPHKKDKENPTRELGKFCGGSIAVKNCKFAEVEIDSIMCKDGEDEPRTVPKAAIENTTNEATGTRCCTLKFRHGFCAPQLPVAFPIIVRLPPTDWVGKVQGFRSSEQDAEEAMEEMENTRKKQSWMGSDASPCALVSQQEAAKRSQFFEDRIGCRQATGLNILGGPVFRKASASGSQSAGTTNTSCLHGVASKLTRDSSPRKLRKDLGRVAYYNVLLFVPRRYLRNPFDSLKLCRVRKPTIPNPYTVHDVGKSEDGIVLDAPLCFPISPLIWH